MKTYEQVKEELRAYLEENVHNFESRVSLAWDCIARNRCSLEYADPALAYEMSDLVEEWCEDNEVENNFDLEELL